MQSDPNALWCGACQQHKPREDFYDRYGTATGRCKACSVESVKKYRQRRKQFQARTYLAPEDKERLRDAQGGGCAVCGAERSSSGNDLSADHDHDSLLFRGLLCHHCNVGIGYFGDDPEKLRRAAAYLEDPPAKAITSESTFITSTVDEADGTSRIVVFEVFRQSRRLFLQATDGSRTLSFKTSEFVGSDPIRTATANLLGLEGAA